MLALATASHKLYSFSVEILRIGFALPVAMAEDSFRAFM
jgi:hypothetical protein